MLYNAFQLARHPRRALPVGGIYMPRNTRSLDPPDAAFQTASRSIHPFLGDSL